MGGGEDIALDKEEELVVYEQEKQQVMELDLAGERSNEFDHDIEPCSLQHLSSSTNQEIIEQSAWEGD